MGTGAAPAAWLVDNAHLIPRGGRVLDVACGRGRHALWLAGQGFTVHAIDRDREALADVIHDAAAVARDSHPMRLTTECVDLEGGDSSLGDMAYDAVIVFHYLHRPLVPQLIAAVAPGGVLIYETFTLGQAARGRPRNPAFLLHAGELPALVHPLRVLRAREGDVDGRLIASIVARRE